MGDVTPLFREANFSPEDIAALSAAYEKARRALHDKGQPDIVNEVIAKRIIRLAKTGERNPERLAAAALAALGDRAMDG